MKNKKVVPTWSSIVLVILCVASIGANLWALIGGMLNVDKFNAMTLLDMACFVASSILALTYCLSGYKKDANEIFKICSIVFTIALLLQVACKALPNSTPGPETVMPNDAAMTARVDDEVVPKTNEYTNTILIITSSISFGCMMVLTIAENLGKKKSSTLIAVILALSLIAAFATVDTQSLSTIILNVNFGAFINAVIYGIMVYAKYQDKGARGTN